MVGQDASQLADALDMALSMIGKGESGRLLVLSDGQWTGRDVSASAARAAAAGVGVDYRAIERPAADDLAIQRVDVPDSVLAGESFMIAAWIDSPRGQTIGYELLRGGRTIAQGTAAVPTGSSRLLFRDTASAGGVCQYVLRVEGGGKDPVPENNRARFLVGVRGNRPLLCVSPTKSSSLPRLLVAAGLKVEARTPPECGWTLEELGGFSGVLLENTPGGAIGHVGMRNLAAWITQAGGGLMLTGGRDGYGSGGYYKSPLDPLLPVSMELRREHRKLSLAIVVALDRSGSMACPASDGRPKIELADLATAEVVNMLGPTDQFGCIAVDVVPHVIVPVSDVTDKAGMCRKILRIDSSGGGIYIHEALETAGAMVASAKAGVRHVVLFADAADSRQHPGEYPRLVANCVKAGITVSVIGLGSERDCDADILKDIARRAGGQCMFTSVAQATAPALRPGHLRDCPQLVHRRADRGETDRRPQVDHAAAAARVPVDRRLQSLLFQARLESGASLGRREPLPVLAAWQAGSGRVLCYTGEADGKYTGAMAGWGEVGNFFSSLARWTAGKSQGLGPGVVATQELRSGVCRVELHLDPGRDNAPFTRLPELTALCARPGEAAVPKKTRLNWASPDVLLAEAAAGGQRNDLADHRHPGRGSGHLGRRRACPTRPSSCRANRAKPACSSRAGQSHRRLRAREPAGDLEAGAAKAAERALVALPAALGRRHFPDRGAPAADRRLVGRLAVVGAPARHGKLAAARGWFSSSPDARRRRKPHRRARPRRTPTGPRPIARFKTSRSQAAHRRQPRSRACRKIHARADRQTGRAAGRRHGRRTQPSPAVRPATHGKEIGALPRSRVSRPVGATDNSPAIYRWGKDRKKPCARPVGTVERLPTNHVFGRPYGTIGRSCLAHPPSSELLGYCRASLRDENACCDLTFMPIRPRIIARVKCMATEVQTVTLAGKRFVIVPENEYRQLLGENREPPLPDADAKGNYPAVESARVVLAPNHP